MMPMGGNGGPPMGGPPAGGQPPMQGGGPGEIGPQQVEGQLIMLLKKAKEMAEKNGLEWSAVLAKVTDNKIKEDVPLPKAPRPGMG